MKDICAILLTPALGKDHFAHNFPFPQNRPPVFYIFTVVSEYVYHNSILAYRSCHCRRLRGGHAHDVGDHIPYVYSSLTLKKLIF